MPTTEQTLLLSLLRAGALGEEPELAPFEGKWASIRPEQVRDLALRHDVLQVVYAALDRVEQPELLRLKELLRRPYSPRLAKAVNQDREGAAMLDAFERAGIDCIPLKGWHMRQYYADPLSRSMADLDVLVRDYNYDKVREALVPLGYSGKGGGAWKHDDFKKPPFMNVEVHKRLTDESGAVRDWERQIWKRCIPEEGCGHRFRMSGEDFYLFHLVHMRKDFRNGALGFRRLVDLWLLKKKETVEDWQYVRDRLREMDLERFAQRMERLTELCFEGAEPDEESETLLRFAAEGAVYATDERYKLGRMASLPADSARKAKLLSFTRAVFLPLERMKVQFPQVERHPALLPWFWLKRIVRYARLPRNRLERMDYRGIDEAQYEQMRRVFQIAGLLPEEEKRAKGKANK